jgi:hypothetical protein
MRHPERRAGVAVTAAVALALAVNALAAPSRLPAQARPAVTPLHRGYAATRDVALRVYLPAGRVRLVAWERDSVDITGTLNDGSTFFGGGARTHVKFGAESQGSASLPGGDIVVRVPRGARAWVKGTTAAIDVQGVKGELELYAVGGSIAVRDAGGVISVESIDAPVTISRSSGEVRVRGGKGRLVLDGVTGTVSVTSVSGAVELVGPRAPEARVETIGGAVRVDYGTYGGTTLELQSHAGDITVVVDRTKRPLLELTSRLGRMPKPTPAGDRKEGRIVARSFRGGINVEFRGGIPRVP